MPLIEFYYNKSYYLCMNMTPYESLYGRTCRFRICLFEVCEVSLIGPVLVLEAMEKVWLIREKLKTTQSRCVLVKFLINLICLMI